MTAAVDEWAFTATPTQLVRAGDALLPWAERTAARPDLPPDRRARVAALRVAALRRAGRTDDSREACGAAIAEYGATAELRHQHLFNLAAARERAVGSLALDRLLAEVSAAERDLPGLGMVAAVFGRFEEAEAFLNAAIEADRYDEFAWYGLAGVLERRGAWESALAAADRSLALRPRGVAEDASEPHRLRCECLRRLRRYPEAIAAARTAIAARPDSARAHVLLWNAAVGDDDGNPNVPALAEAHASLIRLHPDSPSAVYLTSYLLHQYGDFAGAAGAARRYSGMNTDDILGPMRWAVSAWRAGDVRGVAEAADAMLALDPNYECGLKYRLLSGVALGVEDGAVDLSAAGAAELAVVADRLFVVKPDQPAKVAGAAAVVYLAAARFADARRVATDALEGAASDAVTFTAGSANLKVQQELRKVIRQADAALNLLSGTEPQALPR